MYVGGDPGNAKAIEAGEVPTEIRVINVDTREERTVLGPVTYDDGGVEHYALLRSPEWDGTGKAIFYHDQRGGSSGAHRFETGRIRRHPLEFVDGSPVDSSDRFDGTVVQSRSCPILRRRSVALPLWPMTRASCSKRAETSPIRELAAAGFEAMPTASASDMSRVVVSDEGGQCHGLPSLDPNGQQLAFYAYPGGEQGLVRVRDLDGGEPRDIASASPQSVMTYPFWPKVAWSGDGQYVAHESWDVAAGQEEILIRAATGGGSRSSLPGGTPRGPAPSRGPAVGTNASSRPRPRPDNRLLMCSGWRRRPRSRPVKRST